MRRPKHTRPQLNYGRYMELPLPWQFSEHTLEAKPEDGGIYGSMTILYGLQLWLTPIDHASFYWVLTCNPYRYSILHKHHLHIVWAMCLVASPTTAWQLPSARHYRPTTQLTEPGMSPQIVNSRPNLNTITNHLIRVIGSKIQIAGWSTYAALINSIKLSMLAFYVRLMVLISIISDGSSQQISNTQQDGLGRRYHIPIYVGFGLVIGSFLASIITIFAACRPFHKNWQINPDPGSETLILS